MIKHIVTLVVLSVITILAAPYLHHALTILLSTESIMAHWLGHIFARSATGIFIARTIALAIVPIIVALIVWGVMVLLKKKNILFAEYVMWVVWLMFFTVLIYKG